METARAISPSSLEGLVNQPRERLRELIKPQATCGTPSWRAVVNLLETAAKRELLTSVGILSLRLTKEELAPEGTPRTKDKTSKIRRSQVQLINLARSKT
jgi:hypothetical protein